MKITFLCADLNLNGGVRMIAGYADHLQKRGHQVTIVSRGRRSPSWSKRFKAVLQGQPIPPTKVPDLTYFQNPQVVIKTIDGEGPIQEKDLPDGDILIATFWLTAEWSQDFSPKKGAKVYFVQHHEVFDYNPPENQERARKTYTLPFHKIVIAQWLKDLMATQYGDEQTSLVPNSVDTQLFNAPPRQKQSPPTVGVMYSPAYWKGVELSFQGVELARQTIPDLRLLVFSSYQPTADLPLPPNCDFYYRPAQDTLKNLYGQCDAWLFGSSIEGFGLPILEAMACRTPVIATPVGAAPELVGQGAGILLPSRDPAEMAQAIIQIAQMSDQAWQNLSEKAYQVATGYTWEDATTRFEQALQTAISFCPFQGDPPKSPLKRGTCP